LLDAFRLIDKKGRGYISKIEMELALNDIGIFPRKEELNLFFKRFDRDLDGFLRYSDFCKAMIPQSSEYASLMNNRIPHYLEEGEGLEIFDFDSRRLFKKLLTKIFESEIAAESLR